jgi:hypothetical protein
MLPVPVTFLSAPSEGYSSALHRAFMRVDMILMLAIEPEPER